MVLARGSQAVVVHSQVVEDHNQVEESQMVVDSQAAVHHILADSQVVARHTQVEVVLHKEEDSCHLQVVGRVQVVDNCCNRVVDSPGEGIQVVEMNSVVDSQEVPRLVEGNLG